MVLKLLSCVCGKYVLPQRYVLCLMTFMGLLVAYSTRVCLHIAITKMVSHVVHNDSHASKGEVCVGSSHDDIERGGMYNWTQAEQGIILAAFFPGYVITHVPGGMMSDMLGGKHIFSSGVVISGIFTLLIPLAVEHGDWWYLVIIRIIVGLAQGPIVPSITTLLAKWVPPRERSTLGSVVTTGAQVGTIAGNLVSSLLMAYAGGWPTVFYFWGCIAILWYLIFFCICYSEPSLHPFITANEAIMLEELIGTTPKMNIPWKKMLLYRPVWALIICGMGHDWIFFLVVVELPKYMSDVLKFNIKENGILNAIPYLALWICSTISGIIADIVINKNLMSLINVRRVATTIGSMCPAVFIILASYMGCNGTAVATMFVLCMFMMGPFYPGMRVNVLDITKNFAGVVMGIVNGLGALTFIPVPYVVAIITASYEVTQWRAVFWTLFCGVLITNIIYIIWASGDRAEWDKTHSES